MESRPDTCAQDFQGTSSLVLQHLLASVGLDVWVVGRRLGDDWLVLSSEGGALGPLEGFQAPWSDTLCSRASDGRGNWATPDVQGDPVMSQAREALGLPLGSFVTVPLHDEDGEVLGTLCGAGVEPSSDDLTECRPQLDLFASLLGSLLSAELRLEREARHREVAELDAQTDPLTGLGNRRRWDRQLAAEEERCRRYGSSAAVLTVDVNGLKVVNDRWGHDAGDALLRQLAGVLRRECRPGDVVARLGGDEFAVLLAEAQLPQAEAVADRLRSALLVAKTSASVGVAARGRDGLTGAWRDADTQMYEHKRTASRREPVQPQATSPLLHAGRDAIVEELLALARRHVGADLAYLTRFEGADSVLRAIESETVPPVLAGFTMDLESTYCQRVVRGELSNAIPDTSLNPITSCMATTVEFAIGAYLGVPVHLPDGQFYGTLCCLSHQPNPRFDATAIAFLESLAGSLSRLLGSEEAERDGRRKALVAIDEVLTQQAFTMAYQPIVDLASGAPSGFEALARFHDGRRTTAQWFDDAAQVERSAELELRTASVALSESGGRPGDLWLNLSASVILSPAVALLLEGQDLRHVVLEISEHEEVRDYVSVREALLPWRAQGLRVAVDDAGAGFSSLRHVLELAPDFIKLDITLVQGLQTNAARRALVTALVAFAAKAGATVVAEGVETEAELQALLDAGVSFGQGYYLGAAEPVGGQPVPAPRRSPAVMQS